MLNATHSTSKAEKVIPSETHFPLIFSHENLSLDIYEHLLDEGKELVIKSILNHQKNVCSGISPSSLKPLFENIDLEKPLASTQDVMEELQTLYTDHAMYFHNPKYVAHLNCPVVTPALMAEQILSAINSSLDTYDQSLGGTFIEQQVIDWTNKRVGYNGESDGIFTSGGTQSNLMALLLARDHYCWTHWKHNVTEKGLPSEASKFRIFTSEASHFSIKKNAGLLGLGQDAVIPVPVDQDFRMDMSALERVVQECRQEGLIPLAVVATCGTTDFGSVDPIKEIAPFAKQHGMWLHADCAYGCGLLISTTHRQLLDGIEETDSVTVDYHKSFYQPVSCGAFLVKDKRHLNYVTYHADYLNPKIQSDEGIPNLVNKSIQTTRRFDALKVWLTLRMMGPSLLGDYFDRPLALAQEIAPIIIDDPELELIHKPELGMLVFRYLPEGKHELNSLNELNIRIRKHLFESGKAVVAGTKVNGVQYLKFTLLNPKTRLEDLTEILQRIKAYGKATIATTIC